MAPRTITEIQGEYGLTQGATGDAFSQQEAKVLDTVKTALSDIRSQQLESAAARGFARSSFTEGAFAKQAGDVVGQVGVEFARARTEEELRQRQFERGIVGQAVASDLETGLTRVRGEEQRLGIGAQAEAEAGLIPLRGEQQRLTLADQLAGEQQLLEKRTEAQRSLTEAQIEAQTAAEKQLITSRGEESRLSLQAQTEAERQLIGERGTETRLTQAENFLQQGQLLEQQAQIKREQITQDYENQRALLDQKYDRIIESLPFELQQKAIYQKEILETQLEIQREQKLIDATVQTAISYTMEKLKSLTGLAGDLGSTAMDVYSDIFTPKTGS